MGGVTSSFTKINLGFVFFDSTRNSPRLHIDMNLDSFSFIGFGVGGISVMATLLLFQLNI